MFRSLAYMAKSRQTILISLGFVLLLLSLRGLNLESMDLIDPTETRYASVAQTMVTSGDWTTPQLPGQGGDTPYLGKPPLHFWLTAMAFSIFGFDEWTARLPSFLGLVLISLLLWVLSKRFIPDAPPSLAPSIAISSGLLFFLSGSSVVDVTFSTMISLAIGGYAMAGVGATKQQRAAWTIVFFLGLSGGFLIKGPVAFILSLAPIVAWRILTGKSLPLNRIPLRLGTLLLICLTVPWFVFEEIRYPGFLKYFFWNENIARYLMRSYGDKYGSGHLRTYGSSWWMLTVAFSPWSFFLLWLCIEMLKKSAWRTRAHWRRFIQENPWIVLFVLWGVTPTVFFTFARQLHAAYVLPGIPGLGLLTAWLFAQRREQFSALFLSLLRYSLWLPFAGTLAMIPIGAYYHAPLSACVITAVAAFGLYLIARNATSETSVSSLGHRIAFATTLLMTSFAVQGSVQAGKVKSSQDILMYIARHSKAGHVTLGMVHENTYSPYWYARAWRREIGKPMSVVYVPISELEHSPLRDIIIKTSDLKRGLPEEVNRRYRLKHSEGAWSWLERSRV